MSREVQVDPARRSGSSRCRGRRFASGDTSVFSRAGGRDLEDGEAMQMRITAAATDAAYAMMLPVAWFATTYLLWQPARALVTEPAFPRWVRWRCSPAST